MIKIHQVEVRSVSTNSFLITMRQKQDLCTFDMKSASYSCHLIISEKVIRII